MKNSKKVAVIGVFMGMASLAFSGASLAVDNDNSLSQKPEMETLNIDLEQLLKESDSVQFARSFDLSVGMDASQWKEDENGNLVWQYGVKVPDATSLTLLLNNVYLPEAVVLNIYNENGQLVESYDSKKVSQFKDKKNNLLTSVVSGQEIVVEFSSETKGATANTRFSIPKVYVGYESTSAQIEKGNSLVQNNMFSSSRRSAQVFSNSSNSDRASQNTFCSANVETATSEGTFPTTVKTGSNSELNLSESCEGNYSRSCRMERLRKYGCFFNEDNYAASRSTAAILVQTDGGLSSCTANLVNNTRNNGENYLLTAAHCGGDEVVENNTEPTIRAYFNIKSVCGTERSSAYQKPNLVVVTGYETSTVITDVDNPNGPGSSRDTAFVNADTWLLHSDNPVPAEANAYWSGINANAPDASSGQNATSFSDGAFNISFPDGLGKHFAKTSEVFVGRNFAGFGEFDRAASWVTYFSLPENIGSVLQGSSGSALFDNESRQRGILSAISSGEDEQGRVESAAELFARIDLSWNPTYEGESFQGLSDFLAPDNNSETIIDGYSPNDVNAVDVQLSPSEGTEFAVGDSLQLSYIVNDASSCQMSADPFNGNWSGSADFENGIRETQNVSFTEEGTQTFTLSCTGQDGSEQSQTVSFGVATSEIDPDTGDNDGGDEGNDNNNNNNNNNNGNNDSDNNNNDNDNGGSGGGGCTMSDSSAFDPTFLLLAGVACFSVVARKKKKQNVS